MLCDKVCEASLCVRQPRLKEAGTSEDKARLCEAHQEKWRQCQSPELILKEGLSAVFVVVVVTAEEFHLHEQA